MSGCFPILLHLVFVSFTRFRWLGMECGGFSVWSLNLSDLYLGAIIFIGPWGFCSAGGGFLGARLYLFPRRSWSCLWTAGVGCLFVSPLVLQASHGLCLGSCFPWVAGCAAVFHATYCWDVRGPVPMHLFEVWLPLQLDLLLGVGSPCCFFIF